MWPKCVGFESPRHPTLICIGDIMNIETFENAFKTSRGSCQGVCECGKQFYNSDGGWSWEEGEIEDLEEENATNLDWSVGFVRFEGKEYCRDCNCWHRKAERLMSFIDSHSHQIANYLNSEKKRKLKEASRMPNIE